MTQLKRDFASVRHVKPASSRQGLFRALRAGDGISGAGRRRPELRTVIARASGSARMRIPIVMLRDDAIPPRSALPVLWSAPDQTRTHRERLKRRKPIADSGSRSARPGMTSSQSTPAADPARPAVSLAALTAAVRHALAAGNLDRLAAGDFVSGIVGHLPEEPGRYRRDDRRPRRRPARNRPRSMSAHVASAWWISTEKAPTATPAEIASCWLTLTSVVARLICAGSISA